MTTGNIAMSAKYPDVDEPQGFSHRFVQTNGIRLHCVEEGEGPLIVLLHGFPYLWYMWRRQLRTLVILNTPVTPREAQRPSDFWQTLENLTGKRFYQQYFQLRGKADVELNADIRKTLRSIYYSISGDAVGEQRWRLFVGKDETFLDTVFNPEQLPSWLSGAAIDYYVSEYTRNGFAAPLSHYQARDRNWEQSAFLEGVKVRQPSLFIGGAADPAAELFMPNYDKLESHLPNLRNKVLLEGVGHSAAEEQPEVVNDMLLAFLAGL